MIQQLSNRRRAWCAVMKGLCYISIALVTVLPFTPLGPSLELAALPPVYFLWLAAIVFGYMALATAVKKGYIRRYGELL